MIKTSNSHNSVRSIIILLIGVGLASPCLLHAADDLAESWVIEKAQWTVDPGAVETIEVHNDFGDLRVRPSDDGQVHLSASIQRHEDDPRRAKIGHNQAGVALKIHVDYPAVDSPIPEGKEKSWGRRRVDVTLFVPIEAELVVVTERGLVEAKGLENPIEARSEWGDIVLSTQGPVVAYSGRGDIDVKFGAAEWTSPARLETLTGSISVVLPADSDVLVEMETRGQLTTDFTLQVAHHPASALKTGTAVIGEASSELYLSSDRGNLSLRRAAR